MRTFVLGRLRDLQYIFAVIFETLCRPFYGGPESQRGPLTFKGTESRQFHMGPESPRGPVTLKGPKCVLGSVTFRGSNMDYFTGALGTSKRFIVFKEAEYRLLQGGSGGVIGPVTFNGTIVQGSLSRPSGPVRFKGGSE